MNIIIRDEEYAEDFRCMFDKLEEVINRHKQRGNHVRAKQTVVKIWSEIQQMEDSFWRAEYEGELRRRYGDFIQMEEEDEARSKEEETNQEQE